MAAGSAAPSAQAGAPPPQQHRVLNQFLFSDRFMQTSYDRRREKECITEPPITATASGAPAPLLLSFHHPSSDVPHHVIVRPFPTISHLCVYADQANHRLKPPSTWKTMLYHIGNHSQ